MIKKTVILVDSIIKDDLTKIKDFIENKTTELLRNQLIKTFVCTDIVQSKCNGFFSLSIFGCYSKSHWPHAKEEYNILYQQIIPFLESFKHSDGSYTTNYCVLTSHDQSHILPKVIESSYKNNLLSKNKLLPCAVCLALIKDDKVIKVKDDYFYIDCGSCGAQSVSNSEQKVIDIWNDR